MEIQVTALANMAKYIHSFNTQNDEINDLHFQFTEYPGKNEKI